MSTIESIVYHKALYLMLNLNKNECFKYTWISLIVLTLWWQVELDENFHRMSTRACFIRLLSLLSSLIVTHNITYIKHLRRTTCQDYVVGRIFLQTMSIGNLSDEWTVLLHSIIIATIFGKAMVRAIFF